MYDAIRGYLEIGQRAKVLSDRCLVISDLLTMLRDDLASNNMNYITWIIIILIVIAVVVAAGKEQANGFRYDHLLCLQRNSADNIFAIHIGEIVVKYLSHFGSEGGETF